MSSNFVRSTLKDVNDIYSVIRRHIFETQYCRQLYCEHIKTIGSVARGMATVIKSKNSMLCASDIDVLIPSTYDALPKSVRFPYQILDQHNLTPTHTSYCNYKLLDRSRIYVEDEWFLGPGHWETASLRTKYCHTTLSLVWALYKLVSWETKSDGIKIVGIYEFDKMARIAFLGSAAILSRPSGVIEDNKLITSSTGHLDRIGRFITPIVGEKEAKTLLMAVGKYLLQSSRSENKSSLHEQIMTLVLKYLGTIRFNSRLKGLIDKEI